MNALKVIADYSDLAKDYLSITFDCMETADSDLISIEKAKEQAHIALDKLLRDVLKS